MAVTFSSEGCAQAATDLNTSATSLDTIVNTDLEATISAVKGIYSSATADELYAAYDSLKAKFPEFYDAVTQCSKYLSETVAPAYKKLEETAAGKISS